MSTLVIQGNSDKFLCFPNLIFLNTLRFPFYISLTKPRTNVSKFLDCKPVLRAKFAISKQLSEDYSLK